MEPLVARAPRPAHRRRSDAADASRPSIASCSPPRWRCCWASSEAAAAARLRRLGRAGHLRRARELHRGPVVAPDHRAPGCGPSAATLPAPRGFDLATHRHDAGLGVADAGGAGGALRRASRGVISEREMRSHDGRATDPAPALRGAPAAAPGPGGRDRLHYPDMVIVTETGHRVAFELELSTKEPDRRERILSRLRRAIAGSTRSSTSSTARRPAAPSSARRRGWACATWSACSA